MKRVCLFAGYNNKETVEDYVFAYLKELSKFADIYYLCDGPLGSAEQIKLLKYVKSCEGVRHESYDFGSWANLIKKIGWEKIEEYDELLLVNDSCYAGHIPFDNMFNEMVSKNLDAWGVAENYFLMSFFVNINKNVFSSAEFKAFFSNIKKETDKSLIILKYEKGLTNILKNYKIDSYFKKL